MVLLCPGQQPTLGQASCRVLGDTHPGGGLPGSGWEMDGACRVGLPGPDPGVPPAGEASWVLCCAGPSVGLGHRAEAPGPSMGAPAVGAGVPLPPSSLSSPTRLVTRPGTFVPHSLWLVATTAFPGSYRVPIAGASSSLTMDLGPPTYRQTALSRQSEHQLENNFQTQREFQEGASLLKTRAKIMRVLQTQWADLLTGRGEPTGRC